MKEMKLLPLVGIEVQGVGRVLFGQPMNEVEKILGKPNDRHEMQLFYDDLELRIDFASSGVEFMECLGGPFCSRTKPMMYDVEVFAVTAEDLISLLTQKNEGRVDDSEAAYGYSFYEISVGVYRELIPSDVEESIREAKQEGTFEENKVDLDFELKKSKHFSTIGIGFKDYYRA